MNIPFRFVDYAHRIPGLTVEKKLFVPDVSEFGFGPIGSHERCAMGCEGGASLPPQLMDPDRDVCVQCIVEGSDGRPCSPGIFCGWILPKDGYIGDSFILLFFQQPFSRTSLHLWTPESEHLILFDVGESVSVCAAWGGNGTSATTWVMGGESSFMYLGL